MKNPNKLLRILEVQEFGLNSDLHMLFEISQVANLINNYLFHYKSNFSSMTLFTGNNNIIIFLSNEFSVMW